MDSFCSVASEPSVQAMKQSASERANRERFIASVLPCGRHAYSRNGEVGYGWGADSRLDSDFGMRTDLLSKQPVHGGNICNAFRACTSAGRVVFVKTHAGPPPGMFEQEAAGLAWLAEGPLRVPAALEVGPDYLVLEWLELAGRPDPVALGRGLAALHRLGASTFGFERGNYLATLQQDNAPEPDWPTFYVERRLRPLCARAGLAVDRELDRLRSHADLFGSPEAPARLHGDLWWGNVGALAGGEPVVFDPAVYGGHREIDLAMLALFGDLPRALIAAYDEVYPLGDGWRGRLALHQLYPLAAHACLFGGGYGEQVISVLREYVGTPASR
jgi:fructosamine-3-kinase